MRMIKALVTGHTDLGGIHLDKYLHDLKYECIEDERSAKLSQTVYNIEIPDDKRDRVITASTVHYIAQVKYTNQVLESIELISRHHPTNVCIMKVDYKEQTLMMKINVDDQETSMFKFEDMRSPDFIFNFDIELGIGEAIKEYLQEIDWFFSEYGSRLYLQ